MQTWLRLFRAAGGEATEIGFLSPANLGPTPADIGRLLRHQMVPEAAVWRGGSIRSQIEAIEPDVVVVQTARSFRPEVADGPWVTILDLVDRLSLSYRQRAEISPSRNKARVLRRLADAHECFEVDAVDRCSNVVAAGYGDAAHLGATWVPNLVDPSARPAERVQKPYHAVFFGSLGYAPNVEALQWLAQAERRHDDLRLLVAGHAPTDEVKRICVERGWTLAEDYPSNDWLAAQAVVSLAPLRSTAGIQNKVLEAAALGLPQVVAPAALAGMHQGFPAIVADTPDDFLDRARTLIEDLQGQRQLADDAWSYTHANYTVDAWLPTLWELVSPSEQSAPAWVNRPSVASGVGVADIEAPRPRAGQVMNAGNMPIGTRAEVRLDGGKR
jgi:hypothetical protein